MSFRNIIKLKRTWKRSKAIRILNYSKILINYSRLKVSYLYDGIGKKY